MFPQSRQSILMCPPDYFDVSYVINPWMEGNIASTDYSRSRQQWEKLRSEIARHADIVLQPPVKGLPDMVFTANAGIVLEKKVIVSRFRNMERQGEEPHDLAWFKTNKFDIVPWPATVPFEGAGDALFDRSRSLLWVGQGFRSDVAAAPLLEKALGRQTQVLHLINPLFYHLDTCFCPLANGYLLYFPGAFDAISLDRIEAAIPAEKRIAVSEEDAASFCCNAVDLDNVILMNGASNPLRASLEAKGFSPVIVELSEFMKAGGSAKCLTLKLIEN